MVSKSPIRPVLIIKKLERRLLWILSTCKLNVFAKVKLRLNNVKNSQSDLWQEIQLNEDQQQIL